MCYYYLIKRPLTTYFYDTCQANWLLPRIFKKVFSLNNFCQVVIHTFLYLYLHRLLKYSTFFYVVINNLYKELEGSDSFLNKTGEWVEENQVLKIKKMQAAIGLLENVNSWLNFLVFTL